MRLSRERNKSTRAAAAKKWVSANRDKIRAAQRRYHSKPDKKAKYAAWMREYRKKHPEKFKLLNKKQRLREKNRASRRASHIKRRAILRGATAARSELVRDFITDIKSRDWVRCYYCRAKTPTNKIHFDHIVPVSKGGSHSISNISASCDKCNLRKKDKPASEMHWLNQGVLCL